MLTRLPPWLRQRAPDPLLLDKMKASLDELSLHTVCEEAHCPNQGECFSKGATTFLILGDICTRNCHFCAIGKGKPLPIDPDEPENVAQATSKLKLKHVVVTSVTRDDLPDGGARHFARTIDAIRQVNPQTTVEVLVPDFLGSPEALEVLVDSSPEVINHNVETVPRLYSEVRPQAEYHRSLDLLRTVKAIDEGIVTKSGMMLGLGERDDEVIKVMQDLREAGCDALTLGQYLCPSRQHRPVSRYISPGEFEEYQRIAGELGFGSVAAGCFVRSSFNAREMYEDVKGLNKASGF